MKFPEYDIVIIIEDWYKTVLGRSGVGAEMHKFALLRMRKHLLVKEFRFPAEWNVFTHPAQLLRWKKQKLSSRVLNYIHISQKAYKNYCSPLLSRTL
jgi:hypothetical protein